MNNRKIAVGDIVTVNEELKPERVEAGNTGCTHYWISIYNDMFALCGKRCKVVEVDDCDDSFKLMNMEDNKVCENWFTANMVTREREENMLNLKFNEIKVGMLCRIRSDLHWGKIVNYEDNKEWMVSELAVKLGNNQTIMKVIATDDRDKTIKVESIDGVHESWECSTMLDFSPVLHIQPGRVVYMNEARYFVTDSYKLLNIDNGKSWSTGPATEFKDDVSDTDFSGNVAKVEAIISPHSGYKYFPTCVSNLSDEDEDYDVVWERKHCQFVNNTHNAKEMTIKEISEKLGYNVKIVKED